MRRYIFLFLSITFSFALETVAIIDFEAIGVSQNEAKAVTQRFTTEMIKIGKFTIVDRSKMKRILDEQKFQYSGCVDISCAVEIGKMLGAKSMVRGYVSKFGNTFSIVSMLIDVKTSEPYVSADYSVKGDIGELLSGIKNVAMNLCEIDKNINVKNNSNTLTQKELPDRNYLEIKNINPTTTINFAIPTDSEVSISVYNILGREVISLANGNYGAGYHQVIWNADTHSSGVYFVTMIAGEFISTQKLMLVK